MAFKNLNLPQKKARKLSIPEVVPISLYKVYN